MACVVLLTASLTYVNGQINNTPGIANSPPPCTKADAYQTAGKWGRQKVDDLAMADRNFPKEQNKPVLAKAQKVIELFMKASPEFKGIEASAKRIIRGDSYIPGGALPFGIDIFYAGYLCVGKDDTYRVDMRGKVILFGGYGTTTVYFNSLRDVLERVQDGGGFLTTDGEEMFLFKKELGTFKGFTMIQPRIRDEGHEAIIITPDNRLPYKPVTREQFLQARIKNYGTASLFVADVASLKSAIARMSPAERQSPALVRDIGASPGGAKLFVTEAEGGWHLVTIDKSFFNPKLPRETIQFITVRWNWNDKDIPKAEAIRLFKQNFPFETLKQMLGK